jgi:signal peptidase II
MIKISRAARYVHGPMTWLGLATAAAAAAVDQATKVWLIEVFDLGARRVVELAPVLDLRLVWNSGISYGLLQQESLGWQRVLLAVKVVAVVLLWGWLAQARTRLTAVSLGLIIGGAVGNAIDRLAYGAVADFVHFHLGSLSWYVFNAADTAIVAGVAGLLYEAVLGQGESYAGSSLRRRGGAPGAPLQ